MSKQFSFTNVQAALTVQIKAIVSRAKTQDTNIRRVMVNCVLVALEHGNTTPATDLCEQIKVVKTIRSTEISRWLEVNGPFTWDVEGKVFKLNRDKAKTMKEELKAKGLAKFATELMALEMANNPEYKGFSTIVKLKAIINEANKIKKDPNKMQSDKTVLTGIEELEAILIKLTANEEIEPRIKRIA